MIGIAFYNPLFLDSLTISFLPNDGLMVMSHGRIRTKKKQKNPRSLNTLQKKTNITQYLVSYQLSRHSLIQAHLLDVLIFEIPDTHPK